MDTQGIVFWLSSSEEPPHPLRAKDRNMIQRVIARNDLNPGDKNVRFMMISLRDDVDCLIDYIKLYFLHREVIRFCAFAIIPVNHISNSRNNWHRVCIGFIQSGIDCRCDRLMLTDSDDPSYHDDISSVSVPTKLWRQINRNSPD